MISYLPRQGPAVTSPPILITQHMVVGKHH